jgi:anti-anti-sigma factor
MLGGVATPAPHAVRDPRPGGRPTLTPQLRLFADEREHSLVIRISGTFDLAGVGMVENAVDVGLESELPRLDFDLTDVDFLDMAGLGVILRADRRARELEKEVRVVPPNGLARRVFTLTRVGDRLTLLKARTPG